MVFEGLPGGGAGLSTPRAACPPGWAPTLECANVLFSNNFQGFLFNVSASGGTLADQSVILLGFPLVSKRFRQGTFGRADLLAPSLLG